MEGHPADGVDRPRLPAGRTRLLGENVDAHVRGGCPHTLLRLGPAQRKIRPAPHRIGATGALDLGPTLLDFFNLPLTPDMLGRPLRDAVADDKPVRDAAIFGQHGTQINVTDGRYVYLRSAADPGNQPLFNYTLMPTHMRTAFPVKQLGANMELAAPMKFTKGCRTLKIPEINGWFKRGWPTLLFDVQADPGQQHPIKDPALERLMIDHMIRLMRECDAPAEQFQRMGLES